LTDRAADTARDAVFITAQVLTVDGGRNDFIGHF